MTWMSRMKVKRRKRASKKSIRGASEELCKRAQGIVEIVDYLDEKLLGFEIRMYIDKGKRGRRTINIYFGPVAGKFCEEVLFAGCNRIGELRKLVVKCRVGTRFPLRDVAQAHGRVGIRLDRRISQLLAPFTNGRGLVPIDYICRQLGRERQRSMDPDIYY